MARLTPSFQDLSSLRGKWGWFLIIGIVLLVLGCLALSHQLIATVFSVYYIGILLVIAGLAQAIQSFQIKGFGQTALWAVMGVLYILIGILALFQPLLISSALTLILAITLIISGVSQTLGSLNNRALPLWGWLLFSGLITLILGIIILSGWPEASLWVLGMFLGIDLAFQGWAYIAMSFAIKNLK
ncbi:HdeD family acid-resistance protein [Zophobihabitans entericus]|uniref:HdeD family acid-resistance protein n=1 Tax=Zophobihabitans entericus TaxID=1635327 RepID=A0A6G9IDF7_9GAMM|nr:HdeD family acid-resistance protein [Zophobihabitans entericus]QIQ22271.1 HdeD family acid-resistance protein [Zophobihabitans entericus]